MGSVPRSGKIALSCPSTSSRVTRRLAVWRCVGRFLGCRSRPSLTALNVTPMHLGRSSSAIGLRGKLLVPWASTNEYEVIMVTWGLSTGLFVWRFEVL